MSELTYVQKLEKDYLRIESKNKRYCEALEFYADERNHVVWNSMVNSKTEVERDKGKKARQALESEPHE